MYRYYRDRYQPIWPTQMASSRGEIARLSRVRIFKLLAQLAILPATLAPTRKRSGETRKGWVEGEKGLGLHCRSRKLAQSLNSANRSLD